MRGGGQDGWIHALPLMVALGFTLFLRLPCRDHSIVREVSEALDAGTLHADMQDPWFSQGFQRFLLHYVRVHAGHRSTRGQTRRALGGCWFSIGFTRDFHRFAFAPLGGVAAGPFPGRGRFR